MDVVGVVVVVEVDGRDNMELGMEDIEENIEGIEENIKYIMDGSHNFLTNLVAKISFGVEMANVSMEKVCYNYFDMNELEIMN